MNESLRNRLALARTRAASSWREIFLSQGCDESYLGKRPGPCPFCGGHDRFIFDNKYGAGNYFCRVCGAGDGFSFVQKLKECSFLEALETVERYCGISVEPSRRHESYWCKTAQPKEVHVKPLLRLWAESVPVVRGDVVWNYLQKRGLDVQAGNSPEIRTHSSLEYFDGDGEKTGAYPAMLARVTDSEGVVINLHRTYLEKDAKASVPCPKKLLTGSVRDGAIRLFPPSEVLGVAEGIETALAARELFGIPVWSLISVVNLTDFTSIPECVRKIVIFGDNDASYAGQAGAYALARKLVARGYEVQVRFPEKVGEDWLDVLNSLKQGR